MKTGNYRDNGMMAVGTILVATGAMSDIRLYKLVGIAIGLVLVFCPEIIKRRGKKQGRKQ